MKKLLILVAVVIIGAVAWYLLSPIWRVEERNEPSPLAPAAEEPAGEAMTKPSDAMAPEEKAAFMEAMDDARGEIMEKMEAMPPAPQVVATAAFVAREHDVKGTALLIEENAKRTLRFEDFETINGPNLHIYLSADLEGNDYVDLGPIRATKGNVNYAIPAGTDAARYRHVLVWCVPFGVLFSSASL